MSKHSRARKAARQGVTSEVAEEVVELPVGDSDQEVATEANPEAAQEGQEAAEEENVGVAELTT